MKREELIEEIAAAIFAVAESGASWKDARMAEKEQHRAEARAALAVMELGAAVGYAKDDALEGTAWPSTWT